MQATRRAPRDCTKCPRILLSLTRSTPPNNARKRRKHCTLPSHLPIFTPVHTQCAFAAATLSTRSASSCHCAQATGSPMFMHAFCFQCLQTTACRPMRSRCLRPSHQSIVPPSRVPCAIAFTFYASVVIATCDIAAAAAFHSGQVPPCPSPRKERDGLDIEKRLQSCKTNTAA